MVFSGIRFVLIGFDSVSEAQYRSEIVINGGVDAGRYDPSCTHVIVRDRVYEDPVCAAARGDGKVLVTDLWVEDSLAVGRLADASRILYQPVKSLKGISGSETLCICLTGYQRQERDDIMKLVELMGAEFSKPLIATKVTHLICYKFEGEKYELARRTKIKTVNHRWLEDCLRAWEILPVDKYNICGWELEIMEAEAKDSEDENELVFPQLAASRKSMQTPSNAGCNVSLKEFSKMNHSRVPDMNFCAVQDKHQSHSFAKDFKVSESNDAPSEKTNLLSCHSTAVVDLPLHDSRMNNLQVLSHAHPSPQLEGSVVAANIHEALVDGTIGPFFERANGLHGGSAIAGSSRRSPHSEPSGTSSGILNSGWRSLQNHSVHPSGSPKHHLEEKETKNAANVFVLAVENAVIGLSDDHSQVQNGHKEHQREGRLDCLSGDANIVSSSGRCIEKEHVTYSEEIQSAICRNAETGQTMKTEEANPDVKAVDGGPSVNSIAKQADPPKAKRVGLGKSLKRSQTASHGKASNASGSRSNSRASETCTLFNAYGLDSSKAFDGNKSVKNPDEMEVDAHCLPKSVSTKDVSSETLKDSKFDIEEGRNNILNQLSKLSSDVTSEPPKLLEGGGVSLLGNCKDFKLPEQGCGNGNVTSPTPRKKMLAKKNVRCKLKSSYGISSKGKINISDNPDENEVEPSRNIDIGKSTTSNGFEVHELCPMPVVVPSENVVVGNNAAADVLEAHELSPKPVIAAGEVNKRWSDANRKKAEFVDLDAELLPSAIKENQSADKAHTDELNTRLGIAVGETVNRSYTAKRKKSALAAVDRNSTIAEKENQPAYRAGMHDLNTKIEVVGEKAITGKSAAVNKRKKVLVASEPQTCHNADKENQPVGNTSRSRISNVLANKAGDRSYRISAATNLGAEPVWFILSGHRLQRRVHHQVVKRLRGRICRDSHQWSYQATHFIVPDPVRRTEKFFAAAAAGRWILKTDYLTASSEAGSFLSEEPFEWYRKGLNEDGAINLEAPRKWRELRERTGHGAFYGMRVVLYGECIAPSLDTLKRALNAGDGLILATSPPYTRSLKLGVDYAIISASMPVGDRWVQEFLRHEVPCVVSDYIVEYVCKPGYSLERHVLYKTHSWAERSFQNLLSRSEEIIEVEANVDTGAGEDLACVVCGSRDRGEVMLICGNMTGTHGCGTGTHIDCCIPPLGAVPEEDWFCSKCSTRQGKMNISSRRGSTRAVKKSVK